MGRRLVPLTLDNLQDLPQRCRSCVFWELDPVSGEAAIQGGSAAQEKEGWISAVLLDWGSCGRVVYVDDVPVGYVLYAPPAYVPRSAAFPTSPLSPDAVQLITAFVLPGYQGQGLGRVMVQTVAKDLLRRGFRAIEVFGDARWQEPPVSCPWTICWRSASRRCGPIPATPAQAGAALHAFLEGGRGDGPGPASRRRTEGTSAAAAVGLRNRDTRRGRSAGPAPPCFT